MPQLKEEVEKRLANKENIEAIRQSLINHGFLESDVDEAVSSVSDIVSQKNDKKNSAIVSKSFFKELFDRFGFGFGSQQYINILFFLSGASLFLIGIINGLRVLLIALFTPIIEEWTKVKRISNWFIALTGFLFALSFVLVILARRFNLTYLFIISFILSAVTLVTFGNSYSKLIKQNLKPENMGILNKISKIGILITAISLFASAYIMDNIKNGYIISFGITVGCFTLSSFIMFLFRCSIKPQETSTIGFFKDLKTHAALFLKNKIILILLIASTITAFVQTIGSIYYGIFIYNFLNNTGFGGFLNVAVVFIVATLSSLLAPYLTRINSKAYGKFPMLVFGTLLIAIMPLTYFYNPNLVAISMATMIGIIGAAIVGVANGLLILDILHERDRKYYFRVSNLLITIPYIITIPIGSFIAQAFGLKTLFLVLGLTLVCAVMPLYLIIIILYHRKFKV
ncbi:MAG: hypothetical protein QF506_03540 [Candidatus Woesearchaeota archaeon]|jgi:hypothetical protein|nr:hypothetical protein [Candidatus Woesearchaeota archaeon]